MMSNARRNDFAPTTVIVLTIAALALGGCASTFDVLPEKMGGLPANAPERPAESAAYPNVYGTPTPRDVKMLSGDEQKSMQQELLSLRDNQNQRANPPPPPPPAAKKQAAKKSPVKGVENKQAPAKPAEKKAADKSN